MIRASNLRRLARTIALIGVVILVDSFDFAGTPEQRKALFADLLAHTLAREAFGPNPEDVREFEEAASQLRKDFLAAKNETALYYVLRRFSNLRRRSAAEFDIPDGGLRPKFVRWGTIPLGVACDFAASEMFVSWKAADLERDATEVTPRGTKIDIGDRVLEVEGMSVDKYVAQVAPYVRWSHPRALWHEAARGIGQRGRALGPDIFAKNDIELVLAKRESGRKYRLRLNWGWPNFDTQEVEEPAEPAPRIPGFRSLWVGKNGRADIPTVEGSGVVLLTWYTFDRKTLEDDLAAFLRSMESKDLLRSDVILDLNLASSAGAHSWSLLQHLTSRPFRVTRCDLRLSDVTPAWAAQVKADAESRLARWIDDVVLPAHAAGQRWLEPIPYHLDALPAESDGSLQPAEKHFTGKLIVLLGPGVQGEAEQLAAMIVDNELGHSIGFPTAGCAAAWIYREGLRLPRSDRAIVEFEWDLGRVLRPNGQVLGGNPVLPIDDLPADPAIAADWTSQAIARALAHLEEARSGGSP